MATLVYLDEPQIVLLDHGNDAKIIGVAIEKEGFEYPFLGAEISFDQWQRYKREFVDLRYLFLVPRWKSWYLFDLAAQEEDQNIPLHKAERVDYKNPEYLPSQGFFARSHTELEVELEGEDISKQKFLIDGTWDPLDLSLFFGRINDLYSFFLGIQKFISEKTTHNQKRALVEAFTDNTLHSGFSYVNFFGDLKGLVGFGERLAMGAIVKKSPGFLDIEGKTDTLHEIRAALDNFRECQSELKAKYYELHSYLSKNGWLKKEAFQHFDKASPVARYIHGRNEGFAELLKLDLSPIEKLTRNQLLTAKILLSYYRRLERYFLFFVEGRVKFGGEIELKLRQQD